MLTSTNITNTQTSLSHMTTLRHTDYSHTERKTCLEVAFLSPLPLTVCTETHKQAYPESLVDVVHQGEQLYKVVHGDGDGGRAKCGGGEGDEAALPLESEDGK